MASEDEMTIDELARRAGMTTRNIRAYQTRGLLPSPQMIGRVAYYNTGHLARLEYITRLLQRGFSLTVIHNFLRTWQEGRSLHDLLGLGEALTAPWSDETTERFTRRRLEELFPEIVREVRLLNRAIELGLLVPTGPDFEAPSPKLIEVGAELVASGIPLSAALDEYARLVADLESIARRFVGLFETHVWERFVVEGFQPEQLGEVTETLQRLRPAASTAVMAIFARAMEREIASSISRQMAKFMPSASTRPSWRRPGSWRT